MRIAAILLILLATALAGCSDGADEPTEPAVQEDLTELEDDTTETPQETETPGGTTEPEPTPEETASKPNQAPTTLFTSDVSAGDLPLEVVFTLNGTDAEGDALEWTFTSGIEGADAVMGTELPGTQTVTYEAEGVFVASLSITDGFNTTESNITITVSAAAVNVPGPIVYSGSSIGSPLGCFVYSGDPYFYYDGALAGFWLFEAEGDPTLGDITTEWWNGDSSAGDLGASGTIPTPSDNVAVCSSMPEPIDFTLTLHHPDYEG